MFPELHSIDKPIHFKNLSGRNMQKDIEIAVTMTKEDFSISDNVHWKPILFKSTPLCNNGESFREVGIAADLFVQWE